MFSPNVILIQQTWSKATQDTLYIPLQKHWILLLPAPCTSLLHKVYDPSDV